MTVGNGTIFRPREYLFPLIVKIRYRGDCFQIVRKISDDEVAMIEDVNTEQWVDTFQKSHAYGWLMRMRVDHKIGTYESVVHLTGKNREMGWCRL